VSEMTLQPTKAAAQCVALRRPPTLATADPATRNKTAPGWRYFCAALFRASSAQSGKIKGAC
jgi:hypothetical protein